VLLLIFIGVPLLIRMAKPRYSADYQQLKLKVDSLTETLPPPAEAASAKTGFDRSDRESQKFYFNPNTISADSLQLLGFSQKQASAIVNYRSRGGKFRTPEDFLRLNVTSNHQHLANYIRIPKHEEATAAKETTPSAQTNYPAKDTAAAKRSFVAAPIDINSADTAALKSLPFIGDKMAQQIVVYRERLGGFTRLEQLCEVNKFLDEEKLERLRSRLTLDLSNVRRFRLTADEVKQQQRHPYLGKYKAEGIILRINHSNEKTTLDDLVKQNLLTADEAVKLQLYIIE
jgi:competence ComEA-like helix-hairpin-helix protein